MALAAWETKRREARYCVLSDLHHLPSFSLRLAEDDSGFVQSVRARSELAPLQQKSGRKGWLAAMCKITEASIMSSCVRRLSLPLRELIFARCGKYLQLLAPSGFPGWRLLLRTRTYFVASGCMATTGFNKLARSRRREGRWGRANLLSWRAMQQHPSFLLSSSLSVCTYV